MMVAATQSFAQLSRDMDYYRGKVIHLDNKNNKITVKRTDGAQRIFNLAQARHPNLSIGDVVLVIAKHGSDQAINVKISKRPY